jgi:hypothetical protein
MPNRRVLLVEVVPEIQAQGGMFYVDFGIDDLPVLAFSPNMFLKGQETTRRAYIKWAKASSQLATFCAKCEKGEH